MFQAQAGVQVGLYHPISIPYVYVKRAGHDTGATQKVKLVHEVQHALYILPVRCLCCLNLQTTKAPLVTLSKIYSF